eukprot:scaffold15401_cov98-Isochrysis_galbana.AAC.3
MGVGPGGVGWADDVRVRKQRDGAAYVRCHSRLERRRAERTQRVPFFYGRGKMRRPLPLPRARQPTWTWLIFRFLGHEGHRP